MKQTDRRRQKERPRRVSRPKKRREPKRKRAFMAVYTPTHREKRLKRASPPKPKAYKRLFFRMPSKTPPRTPFRHKPKKRVTIDIVSALLWTLAIGVTGLVVWLITLLL